MALRRVPVDGGAQMKTMMMMMGVRPGGWVFYLYLITEVFQTSPAKSLSSLSFGGLCNGSAKRKALQDDVHRGRTKRRY